MNFAPRITAKKEHPARHLSKYSNTPEAKHARLVQQTEKWVAQTFYGTLLKQMHNGKFKDKKFSGGRGGEAFQAMFDQRIADRMSHGAGGKLVQSLVKRIEKNQMHGKNVKQSTLNVLAK